MNILLLAENWPPRIGGIEKYLTNIAKGLSKEPTNKVIVVAPTAAGSKEGAGSKKKTAVPVTDYRLLIIRKRFFWPFIRPKWLPLLVYLYRLATKENIDVVLCGKVLFEGLVGHYLKKYLGIPYVVFTYAMEIAEWKKSSSESRKLERVLKNADKIVCINEATRKKLLELGASEKQLVKIYPGVEKQYFSAKLDTAILEKYSIKQPYIISVGRLIPRKGFDDLIEAYSKLDQQKFSEVALVIVGEGPEREKLNTLAQKIHVQPKFLGAVPDDDLPALYAGAELFVLTPKEIAGDVEGFGIVYLEANAAGLPVIGTQTGGVPEAVIHEKTGLLVEPADPESIIDGLERLLSNKNKSSALGSAGRERDRHKFTWQEQVNHIGNMLHSIYI